MSNLTVRCCMVSVVVLRCDRDGVHMLIVRRASAYLHGAWSYIAGHIESGETAVQAARRELQEETGLTPDALYATSFCERFYNVRDDLIEVVPAFVAWTTATDVYLNDEHSAYQWVSPDVAADQLPFGSQRDLLAHVRREFIARVPSFYGYPDLMTHSG